MKEKHTRSNYKRHWQPELLNKEAYETWMESKEMVAEKGRQKAKDILASHKHSYLPIATEAEIERILQKHLGPEFSLRD